MKKIITAVTALIAMSVAFMSCGFTDGAAEPQYDYKTADINLSKYNTKIGYYPSQFEMPGADFAMLDGADQTKITISGEMTTGASYYQIQVMYGNNPEDSTDGWKLYDEPIYDEDGNKIALDDGHVKTKKTFILKPTSDKILKRGLIMQGANFEITSLKIQYVGAVEYVNTNIDDFSKVEALEGNGKIILEPTDANISTLKIVANENTDEYVAYKFTGAADLSSAENFILNMRTAYELSIESDKLVKKTYYKLGNRVAGPIMWNAYCLEKGTENHLVNMYADKKENLSLKDIKSSKDFNAGVYNNDYSSGTGGTIFPVAEGDEKIYPYYKDSEVESKEGEDIRWKPHYLYSDPECTKKIEGEADFRFKVQLISEKGTSTYSFEPDTVITGDYTDFILPMDKFEKTKDFDLKKVTGYKIITGYSTTGTFYIDSIIIK